MKKAAYWLTLAAAVAPLASIAATSILLGAAILTVLLAYRRLEMPRGLMLPIALFAALTSVAILMSPDPRAGLPALKKFYIYLTLPVVYTVFRGARDVKYLLLAWTALASLSALWSFVQFWTKRQSALANGFDFYRVYVSHRTTGFMSHWMTFGGQEMIVVLMVMAALLFGWFHREKIWIWPCVAVMLVAIALGFTRSVWLGTAVGAAYLVAAWRPKLLLLVPVVVPLAWFAAPRSLRERVTSIYQPHGEVDSNSHRRVTSRTGLEMIRSKPVFGLGPEIVKRDFEAYLPADISKPLPEGYYGHLHNVFLQYAAERGLPALLCFVWLLVAVLVHCWRATTHHLFVHGTIAVLLAIAAEGMFEFNLGDSEVLSPFLSAIACAYILTERRETHVDAAQRS